MTINPSQPGASLDARIAAELANFTEWTGGPRDVWARSLEGVGGEPRSTLLTRSLGGGGRLAIILLLLVPVVFAAFLLPTLGKARMSARPMSVSASAPAAGFAERYSMAEAADAVGASLLDEESEMHRVESVDLSARASDTPVRLVARKASIDLAVPDVRAAFAKAAFVVSEAGGEFVQDSSLSGEGERAQANLTLRIRADRLGQVLTQLRDLGIVVQESASGEDVTDQAVDIEARLRNEQRVETELAELLATRKDAPLKEILDVREALGSVRGNIERLVAQRDRLSRLVSLATVLVVIRHESAVRIPEHGRSDGLGEYFTKSIAAAWKWSTRTLADTIAFIVAVAVGGAIWWITAAIGLFAALRWRKRAHAARAREPAPTI